MFKVSKIGTIAGCAVVKGKIVRNFACRVTRGGQKIAAVERSRAAHDVTAYCRGIARRCRRCQGSRAARASVLSGASTSSDS